MFCPVEHTERYKEYDCKTCAPQKFCISHKEPIYGLELIQQPVSRACFCKKLVKLFCVIMISILSHPFLFLDPFHLFLLHSVVPDVTQRTVTLETLSEEHAIVSLLSTLHLSQSHKYYTYGLSHLSSNYIKITSSHN